MDPSPIVSIVSINFNSAQHTQRLLDSVLALRYPLENVEIILIDNHSSINEVNLLRTLIADYKFQVLRRILLVTNDKNVGVGSALNQAIRLSSIDVQYIWRLDNDVILHPECLTEMLHAYRSNSYEKIGTVCSRIINIHNGSDEMMACVFLKPPRLWTRMYKQLTLQQIKDGLQDKRKIGIVTGTSCLYPRHVFNEVGFFDEKFFVYCEDREFCLRLILHGYILYPAIQSIAYHYGSGSTIKLSSNKIYYIIRNQLLVGITYFKRSQKNYFILFQLLSMPWRFYCYCRLFPQFKPIDILCNMIQGINDFRLKRFGNKQN